MKTSQSKTQILTDDEAILLYRAAHAGTANYPIRRSRGNRGFVLEPTNKGYPNKKLAIEAYERWCHRATEKWLDLRQQNPNAILTAEGVRL